jgi:hypothetical protein
MALHSFTGPWPLLRFLDLFTHSIGLVGLKISSSQGRWLHTGQHKQNKRTQTFMPWDGFEPTTPAFERAKTVHALDHAATAIGSVGNTVLKLESSQLRTAWSCKRLSTWIKNIYNYVYVVEFPKTILSTELHYLVARVCLEVALFN